MKAGDFLRGTPLKPQMRLHNTVNPVQAGIQYAAP